MLYDAAKIELTDYMSSSHYFVIMRIYPCFFKFLNGAFIFTVTESIHLSADHFFLTFLSTFSTLEFFSREMNLHIIYLK